jgi:hypothetical protein
MPSPTDASVCPAMIRSMKHRYTNKNWSHNVHKYLCELNVPRLKVLKNQLLKICWTAPILHKTMESYKSHTFPKLFITGHMKSPQKM